MNEMGRSTQRSGRDSVDILLAPGSSATQFGYRKQIVLAPRQPHNDVSRSSATAPSTIANDQSIRQDRVGGVVERSTANTDSAQSQYSQQNPAGYVAPAAQPGQTAYGVQAAKPAGRLFLPALFANLFPLGALAVLAAMALSDTALGVVAVVKGADDYSGLVVIAGFMFILPIALGAGLLTVPLASAQHATNNKAGIVSITLGIFGSVVTAVYCIHRFL